MSGYFYFKDLSSKTGDELISMGNALLALSTSEIGTVTNTSFDEAVATIGSIKGFSREQLEAWAAKAKQVNTVTVLSRNTDCHVCHTTPNVLSYL
jgi:hypothetical protein